MAKSRIDIAKIVGLTPSAERQRARRVAVAIIGEWKRIASSTLQTSRQTYVQGLIAEKVDDPSTVRVTLQGQVPNLVEQGMGPGGIGTEGTYDQRNFVLKPGTKSLHFGKNGMYVHVPQGHSVKEIRALAGAAAASAAKLLEATRSKPDGGTLWGGRLGAEWGRLAGMVRQVKTYAASTQSQYKTWRTMSEGGQPWITPGVKARHIAAKVHAALPGLLARVL
jgi:hypothetical protein